MVPFPMFIIQQLTNMLSTDVNVVPTNGTWFQLISNGTTTINNGPNGLPRLDKVVELAEQHGIYLLLSLTNNWNPFPGIDDSTTTTVLNVTRRDVTPGTNNRLNRNYLCNNYGQFFYVFFYAVVCLIDDFQEVWMHTYVTLECTISTTNSTRTRQSLNCSKIIPQALYPAMSTVQQSLVGNLLTTRGL